MKAARIGKLMGVLLFLVRSFPCLQKEMQRFVEKIVDLIRQEMLFSWQGGPIILLQVS